MMSGSRKPFQASTKEMTATVDRIGPESGRVM